MNTNTASQLGAGDNLVAPVRAGELVADKYLIERTLGVGGMGVVVAARDQLLDRRVAIKFLLPKLAGSDTAVQRFMREARAATRITSEHVVRLLEIEKLPSGTPFFVMEYLEGSDLRAVLRERGVLAPSLAVDYILQAVQAVAEGHVRGVVHRDIKPSNVFLSRRADGTPLIKVLDFGIAKTIESDAVESTSLTSSDDVRLGSPAYMPPEQLQNPRDADTRSDIWSLGATLYELLCGRPPFEGATYLELASHILSHPPKPLAQQAMPGMVPDGLEDVLGRCLEKDREARYANAAELAHALAPYGSADARMSLTRVSGMFASSSSFPALVRSASYDVTDCAPTLDVAGEGSAQERNRRTSDIGPVASTPPSKSGRSWLVVAAVGVMLTAVVALRSHPPAQAATATPLPAVQPAALSEPPSERRAEPKPVAPRQLAETPKAVVAPAQPPKVAVKPVALARIAPPAPIQGAALRVETLSEPPASAVLQETATAADAAPSLGRSAEIERLIEQRR
jgi:eukaryotic-like serine/threonine-protein kinase